MSNTAYAIVGLFLLVFLLYTAARSNNSIPKIKELFGKKEKKDGGGTSDYEKIRNSIGVIATSLLICNWLCAEIGWKWWWIYWEEGPFWISQLGILFTAQILISATGRATKLCAFAILGFIVAGWVHVVLKSESSPSVSEAFDETLAEIMDHPHARTILIEAGVWTKISVPKGKRIDVAMNPPVEFSLRVNEERKVYKATPGTYLDMDQIAPENPTHYWVKPEQETEITITTQPQ